MTIELTEAEEKAADARVEAAMDAFYPGENWRVDLGVALEGSLRDMRAAILAADTAAQILLTPEGGEALREAVQKEVREIRLWAESHESLETASDLDTVADNLEAALALAPKTSVSGNDAGMREVFNDAALARDEYGFLGTPADCIRFLVSEIDRLQKPASEHSALPALSPPTGSAGGDETGVREGALEKWWNTSGIERHDAKTAFRAAWALAPQPPKAEIFPRGAGTGTYFRRLPDDTWVMLNSGGQWVTMPAPTWPDTPPKAEAPAGVQTPVYLKDIAAEVDASLAPAARAGGGVERVRHLKRGTEYEVLGEAEVQIATRQTCPDGIGNGVLPNSAIIREGRAGYESDRLTVYRDPKSGKLWCRFTDEFRDGRFVTLTAAPAANGEGA